MDPLLITLIICAVVIGIIVLYFQKIISSIKVRGNDNSEMNKRMDLFSQHMSDNLNNITTNVLNQLNEVTKQVNERLKENTEVIQREHRSVGERLDTAAKVVNTVNSRLSRIEEGNKKIYDVGKEIASLQDILKAPKMRGGLGEQFLYDLLSQIFPKDHFTMQYGFKTGEKVDAVIHVRDGLLIPVDSKFPLENFKKMMEEDTEEKRDKIRKMFVSDVKKRIDEISTKYILPDEGTMDFALMYVPAENVYYEMIIKDQNEKSISAYAIEKKVIPVSPNTFYIYLQTLLMGLRGLQVEKQTMMIMASLSRLKGDFEKFGSDFTLVGKHLGHAKGSFDSSEKKLERFTDKLENIESLSFEAEQKKLIN